MEKNLAFTLAEVLITLGIIGVVAAMTVPSLISSINDMHYKTAYKKAFSIASQAWETAVTNQELQYYPSSNNLSQRLANFAAFQSHFNVTKSCWDNINFVPADITSCWTTSDLWWAYAITSTGIAFIDNSGMVWALIDTFGATDTASFLVDTNGLKSPNKYGQDRFVLVVRAADGTTSYGDLVKILPLPGDCLSTSNCALATSLGTTWDYVCPSVATHPCYYKSWITGEN